VDDPVASTLPDEGIDLYRELDRYRDWLIAQALIRTGGNRAGAARLLGIKRTTLVMMLKASKPRAASPDLVDREPGPGHLGIDRAGTDFCDLQLDVDGLPRQPLEGRRPVVCGD
jgi:hypothetical protein